MNKQDTIIVVILFACLAVYMFFDSKRKAEDRSNAPVPAETAVDGTQSPAGTNAVKAVDGAAPVISTNAVTATPVEPVSEAPKERQPEQRLVISNEYIRAEVSSWSGGIVGAELQQYNATIEEDSSLVSFDFSDNPAMSLSGIKGLSSDSDFTIERIEGTNSVLVTRKLENGLQLRRTIELADNYRFVVKDSFVNNSAAAVDVPGYGLNVGAMRSVTTQTKSKRAYKYLAADTLGAESGKKVIHWVHGGDGKEVSLTEKFQPLSRQGSGCLAFTKPKLANPLPSVMPAIKRMDPTSWVAVKNKFFVQIVSADEDAAGFVLNAERDVPEAEDPEYPKTWAKKAELGEVSAQVLFAEKKELAPGKTFERTTSYYVGPKKYSELKKLGGYQDRVMFRTYRFFGWFRVVCIGLISALNIFYGIIPSYGVAIILLTLIVKVLFWPIMQKSTASMKKMQSLKPELDKLKEKHKDNPQKMQQEQMLLYRKHNINPFASCLPMFIQMPVFIAMFNVIRKAVELRHEGFLWIADLSEPEMLFAETISALPIIGWIGAINILPITMAATMAWQQKLTPSSGDPQQKQMMMMMPVMMLFFLYNMASGLTLYWTVSQALSIVQLYVQRRKDDDKDVAEPKTEESKLQKAVSRKKRKK